ncbi:MAG: hypothetical protein ABIP57_17790 [Jatrophihabitantaceae bacterium]
MDGQRGDDVTYLRLLPEPELAARRPGASGIKRWLGLDQRRVRRLCRQAGHLPVRTVSGTDCQRCAAHWDHL